MLLAAVLTLLAADKAVVESLTAPDSVVRARAAYALARIHDPSDGAAAERLSRILVDGETDQKMEAVRGLLCREWPSGMPARTESAVLEILETADVRAREAVIDGTRCLPKSKAAAILLREEPLADKRSEGVAKQVRLRILRAGTDMAIPELRVKMKEEIRRRSEFLFYKKDCTLEACAEDLATLAALGEDVSWMKKRLESQRPANFFETLLLLRLDAVNGDERATEALAESAQASLDPEIRRKAVEWLLSMPAAPRSDAMAGLLLFVEDIEPRIRRRVIAAFASAPVRHASLSRQALKTALDDPDPAIRLEAAVGLRDLREAVPLGSDPDPLVRAAANRP